MTDRELDELGTSLLALDRQSQPRQSPPVQAPAIEAAGTATGEWTAEQLRRLDEVFRE